MIDNNNQAHTFGSNQYNELGSKYFKRTGFFSIPNDNNIIHIDGGYHNVPLITSKNNLYVFGRNKYGESGVIPNTQKITPAFYSQNNQ